MKEVRLVRHSLQNATAVNVLQSAYMANQNSIERIDAASYRSTSIKKLPLKYKMNNEKMPYPPNFHRPFYS